MADTLVTRTKIRIVALTVAVLLSGGTPVSCFRASAAVPAPGSDVRTILDDTGIRGGLIVHLGCGDGRLTAALCAGDSFLVHGLDPDSKDIDEARRYIQSRGVYGKVSVEQWDGNVLPYVDNLVNLVVAEDCAGIPESEIMRVLAPNGAVVTRENGRWTKRVKPWPGNIDEWTHYLHGADGNAVSADTVVGPPESMQWTCGPLFLKDHDTVPGISALVSAAGRIFYIIDEAPKSVLDTSMPDKWSLVARDAFNGVLLWKQPIREWGWSAWRHHWFHLFTQPVSIHRRLVAVGDEVYATLNYNAPLSVIDAATGEVLRTIPGTEYADEIVCHRGRLVLSLNTGPIPKKNCMPYLKRNIHEPNFDPGEKGTFTPPGKKVAVFDAKTGERLWERDGYVGRGARNLPGSNVLSVVAADHSVCFLDKNAGNDLSVVCLDFETGTERWTAAIPKKRHPTPGQINGANYTFGGEPILCGDVLLVTLANQIVALSTKTGETLWTEAKSSVDKWTLLEAFVIDGRVWVWGAEQGEWSEAEKRAAKVTNPKDPIYPLHIVGLNVKTGEVEKRVALGTTFKVGHHHRCYRNKATSRYVIAGRRGAEFVDLASGQHSINYWVRGVCAYGIMPCNGLFYAPPQACQCSRESMIQGFWALSTARKAGNEKASRNTAPKLVRGPAYPARMKDEGRRMNAGKVRNGADAEAPPDLHPSSLRLHPSLDWPTYRHDPERSSSTQSSVSADLKPRWTSEIPGRLSSPTVCGERVYLCSVDSHCVIALSARDGTQLWRYTTSGRVDSPPTIHNGTVLFGSADGSVYCLDAGSGDLAWRFHAAPGNRRVCSFGQLESAWPVHGSVLVKNGVAYFAAGRSSYLDGGIYLYGLDPATGKVLHQAHLDRPPQDWDKLDTNPLHAPGALSDILLSYKDGMVMRTTGFSDQLAKQEKTWGTLRVTAGFLDDSYFKRFPWGLPNIGHGAQLIALDETAGYSVRMRRSDKALYLKNDAFFKPGAKGYALAATDLKKRKKELWSTMVPVRIQAMVATPESLFIAGPPDIVDPKDPFAAFEGRKGGCLWAVAKEDGTVQKKYDLDAPPVFNGMAAAGGKLFAVLANGSVLCMEEE